MPVIANHHPRRAVDTGQPEREAIKLRGCDKISFCDDQQISDGHLVHRLELRIKRAGTIHGISQRNDSIHAVVRRNQIIYDERMMDRSRISDPCSLDHDTIKRQLPALATHHERCHGFRQIAADRAA